MIGKYLHNRKDPVKGWTWQDNFMVYDWMKYLGSSKLIYDILVAHINHKSGLAYPSIDRMCELSDQSKPTVIKQLKILIVFNLIERIEVKKGNNQYKVFNPDYSEYSEIVQQNISKTAQVLKKKKSLKIKYENLEILSKIIHSEIAISTENIKKIIDELSKQNISLNEGILAEYHNQVKQSNMASKTTSPDHVKEFNPNKTNINNNNINIKDSKDSPVTGNIVSLPQDDSFKENSLKDSSLDESLKKKKESFLVESPRQKTKKGKINNTYFSVIDNFVRFKHNNKEIEIKKEQLQTLVPDYDFKYKDGKIYTIFCGKDITFRDWEISFSEDEVFNFEEKDINNLDLENFYYNYSGLANTTPYDYKDCINKLSVQGKNKLAYKIVKERFLPVCTDDCEKDGKWFNIQKNVIKGFFAEGYRLEQIIAAIEYYSILNPLDIGLKSLAYLKKTQRKYKRTYKNIDWAILSVSADYGYTLDAIKKLKSTLSERVLEQEINKTDNNLPVEQFNQKFKKNVSYEKLANL